MKCIPLCEPIGPRSFRNFIAGHVLASPWLDCRNFLQSGLSLRGVLGRMFFRKLQEQVWPFQDDAASGVLCDRLAEVSKELAMLKFVFE